MRNIIYYSVYYGDNLIGITDTYKKAVSVVNECNITDGDYKIFERVTKFANFMEEKGE